MHCKTADVGRDRYFIDYKFTDLIGCQKTERKRKDHEIIEQDAGNK